MFNKVESGQAFGALKPLMAAVIFAVAPSPNETNAVESMIVPDRVGADAGVYLDSSALAKLYVPEAESDRLDAFLRSRRDLLISELASTEVLTAVARRRGEGALTAAQAVVIRDAVLADAESSHRDIRRAHAHRRLACGPQGS